MKIPARRVLAQRWFGLRWGIPYSLLTLGSALAIVAAWYVLSNAEARLQSDFLTDAQKARHQIEARLNSHFDVVQATAALVTSNNEINGAEFRAFVSALHLHRQYPGLRAIGFAPRVPRHQLKSFLRLAALDGTPLTVWARSSAARLLSRDVPRAQGRRESRGHRLRFVGRRARRGRDRARPRHWGNPC